MDKGCFPEHGFLFFSTEDVGAAGDYNPRIKKQQNIAVWLPPAPSACRAGTLSTKVLVISFGTFWNHWIYSASERPIVGS